MREGRKLGGREGGKEEGYEGGGRREERGRGTEGRMKKIRPGYKFQRTLMEP